MSDRFRELAAFVAVAETGAFNAAARQLGQSAPAITRLVTSLEVRLGVQLFARTTRRVALTEAGRRLFEDAARILAELEEAEASAIGDHAAARGMLRVTAPVLFGQMLLAPVLRDFLEAHDGLAATLILGDRTVDLIGEGLDLALRIGDLADSTLTATRVGAVRRMAVAAPAYLERCGAPTTPEDLAAHRIIQPGGFAERPEWSFHRGDGRRSVRLEPRLTVNTVTAAIDAATAGWGVTRVLSYQVAGAVASGALVEILAEFEDRAAPVHLLHAEGRRAAAKIRGFVDFAAARLRRAPALRPQD